MFFPPWNSDNTILDNHILWATFYDHFLIAFHFPLIKRSHHLILPSLFSFSQFTYSPLANLSNLIVSLGISFQMDPKSISALPEVSNLIPHYFLDMQVIIKVIKQHFKKEKCIPIQTFCQVESVSFSFESGGEKKKNTFGINTDHFPLMSYFHLILDLLLYLPLKCLSGMFPNFPKNSA